MGGGFLSQGRARWRGEWGGANGPGPTSSTSRPSASSLARLTAGGLTNRRADWLGKLAKR